MSNTICKKLHQHLASLYGLYVKTHNYHWNVEGIHFNHLHAMFQEQYEDLAEAIDLIAERIRQLGEKVPASLDLFAKSSAVKPGDEKADYKKMLKDLLADHKLICNDLDGIVAACGDDDEATKDIAIERLRVHGKAVWMLESSLA